METRSLDAAKLVLNGAGAYENNSVALVTEVRRCKVRVLRKR